MEDLRCRRHRESHPWNPTSPVGLGNAIWAFHNRFHRLQGDIVIRIRQGPSRELSEDLTFSGQVVLRRETSSAGQNTILSGARCRSGRCWWKVVSTGFAIARQGFRHGGIVSNDARQRRIS